MKDVVGTLTFNGVTFNIEFGVCTIDSMHKNQAQLSLVLVLTNCH